MTITADEASQAFLDGREYSKWNDSVVVNADVVSLRYHGNEIAWRKIGEKTMRITLAGWPTVTTRVRLNCLPGVSVHQCKGDQFLNGKPWDGEEVELPL